MTSAFHGKTHSLWATDKTALHWSSKLKSMRFWIDFFHPIFIGKKRECPITNLSQTWFEIGICIDEPLVQVENLLGLLLIEQNRQTVLGQIFFEFNQWKWACLIVWWTAEIHLLQYLKNKRKKKIEWKVFQIFFYTFFLLPFRDYNSKYSHCSMQH